MLAGSDILERRREAVSMQIYCTCDAAHLMLAVLVAVLLMLL